MVTTTQVSLEQEISDLEKEIAAKREHQKELRQNLPATEVKDHSFKASGGKEVRLSGLFGGKDELIMIHNMGEILPLLHLVGGRV